jgi:hypothetical protein
MGGDLPQHLMVATDAVPATAVDGDGVRPVGPPTHRHSLGSWSPSPSLITGLAFAVVAVPFGIAVIRLLAAPGGHVYLPDDLALIDLHTRRALQWKQQLGVFDHNEWNHPGPSYFYLLSVAYRILGSGAKAMFVGATLINAGAALACVGVVRRRASPARALWAAAWLCVLASLLAAVGPGSVAYSEGALGGLVSPWNPMVVIFPLVLLLLLCAGAMDRSVLSLVGALVVGSFVIQTNVSALPMVVVAVVAGAVAWVVTVVVDRRHHLGTAGTSRGVWVWSAVGGAVFVLMWLPPVIQQLTNHPGNFTLLYRFFTAPDPGHSLQAGLNALVAVDGIVTVGPSEVMHASAAATPHHQALVVATTVVLLLVAAVTALVGWRQRLRFATGLGLLGLAGSVTLVWSVTHLEGHPYGYLVVWAVAVPLSSLIGLGMLRWPWSLTVSPPPSARRLPLTSVGWVRTTACLVAVAVSVVVCVRVVAIPALAAESDPQVGQLRALVVPSLTQGSTVFVNDSGAGANADSRLLDVEKFIGLVNLLDQGGYHPKVNHVWRAEFGPGFEADGHEQRSIELSTWTPSSPGSTGYLGRVGDLAVNLLTTHDPADSPG